MLRTEKAYERQGAAYDTFIESLPKGLVLKYYWTHVDSDLLNGGIRQFFFNHTPWQVERTVAVCEKFGATETAGLLRQAIAVFAAHSDWRRRSRRRFDEDSWDDDDFAEEPTLDAIDVARCNDGASRRDFLRLVAYFREHPAEFVYPP